MNGHRIDLERLVEARVERVWEVLTDVAHADQTLGGVDRVELLTEGPYQVGTRWRETRRMFGKEATEHFEVTACVPGKRLGLKVDGTKGTTGKGEYRFDYDFEPDGAGTRLRTRAEIDMPGGLFTKIIGKLMGGAFKKACDKDLDALKTYLEGKRGS